MEKKLVELCLQNGHTVTILTRGQSGNPFGAQVKQLIVNRDDAEALAQALESSSWDIVFDNICYASDEAQKLCEILEGKTKKTRFYLYSIHLRGRWQCKIGRGF